MHNQPISIPMPSTSLRNQRLPSFSSNRFQLPRVRKARRPKWSRRRTNLSSGPSVGSNCARWCRLQIAPSTRWNSVASFRDASPSRPAASSGTWRRWRLGWLRGDQSPSPARSLLTSGNGDRARFESRVGFKQRHRRRDEHGDALLRRDPGIDDIRPLLHHVATLSFVFCLVVDAA